MSAAKRKPFQEATVKHVLDRLTALRSSRRFLVADEVGLGKTFVAQGVLEELTKRPPGARPPVVFYMCSSKTIAEQNRAPLLSMIPTKEEQDLVTVKAGRLGLVPASPPPSASARFHFYGLSPSITSGDGTGRVEERALLVDALRTVSSTLRGRRTWKSHMQRNVRDARWEQVTETTKLVDGRVGQRFRRQLCDELKLSPHARDVTLADAVEGGLRAEPLSTIEAMRRAMTFAVLGVLQPDVVILDEFQRFFEFLPKKEETLEEEEEDEDGYAAARRVMGAVLEGVGQLDKKDKRPYVLMLSATPYRLYSRSIEGGRHHEEFYDLLDFLHDDRGHASRKLKDEFLEYSERLLADEPNSERVMRVRAQLERKLLEVMCRTERDALVGRLAEPAKSREESAKLEPADIRAFKVLGEIAASTKLGAEPYWSSIPFAFQAMDEQYALRRKGKVPQAKPGDLVARLDYRSVRRYTAPQHGYPHPRLRKLIEVISPSFLALPWLPPTRPWWELGGVFSAAAAATKTLVFSRFRAVPRILAAVLSYEAEKKAFERRRFDYAVRSHGARDGERAKVLDGLLPQPRPTFGITFDRRRKQAIRTFVLFAPFPVLAGMGDPLPHAARIGREITYAAARSEVRKNLEKVLLRGRPPAAETSRKPRVIEWLATIEKPAPGETSLCESLEAGLDRWATKREEHGDGGAKVCRYFLRLARLPESEVPTSVELDVLAEIALSAPGVVCARAFERVFGPANGEQAKSRSYELVEAGLMALRPYLDAPEWRELLAQRAPGERKKRLPFAQALERAVWDGGLEAVLDELFATYCGYTRPEEETEKAHIDTEKAALERFRKALSIHGAQVSIHHLRRKPPSEDTRSTAFRMRCHAAAPLGLTASEAAEDGDALRSDHLRIAFNSPFRPMALVTTSIGQEGLDFHTYARRVVHWDLPSNPVELEQRDGRIARFGSHAVRRALADMASAPPLEPNRSPWLALGDAATASQDESGIAPWWCAPNAAIERVFIVPSFSRVRTEIRELHDALGLYRVVLGQPGQERLLHALRARVDRAEGAEKAALQEWYEKEALCLSPFLRRQMRQDVRPESCRRRQPMVSS